MVSSDAIARTQSYKETETSRVLYFMLSLMIMADMVSQGHQFLSVFNLSTPHQLAASPCSSGTQYLSLQ